MRSKPEPARRIQRIDKNSSRTAGRHKYSNKGRLCVVVGPPSECFISRIRIRAHKHTHIQCLVHDAGVYVKVEKEREAWLVFTKRDYYPRLLSFTFVPCVLFLLSCFNSISQCFMFNETFASRSRENHSELSCICVKCRKYLWFTF